MPILSAASSTGNDIRRTPQKYYAEPGANYETIFNGPRSIAYPTRGKTRRIPYNVEPNVPYEAIVEMPPPILKRSAYEGIVEMSPPILPPMFKRSADSRIRPSYHAEPDAHYISAVGGSRRMRGRVSGEGYMFVIDL